MATHIEQLLAADGWYAVFARVGSNRSPGLTRPSAVSIRPGEPVPEFLPLVGWALIVDDTGREPERIVGIVVHEDQLPEQIDPDDPGFLGYAGPGDAGTRLDRVAPDWRALARQAISELKKAR